MKVKCIDTTQSHGTLKLGKIYDVVRQSDTHYYFELMGGHEASAIKSRFTIVQPPAPVCPQPPAPSNPLMKCYNAEGKLYLTVGKEYEVIGSTDTQMTVINDVGERYSYEKHRFDPAGKVPAAAVTSHEHAAYQKIVKIEKYETTDGKSFVIENEAMKHQLLLNAKADFVGPAINVADRDYFDNVVVELEDVLTWAKDFPDSFDTLVRLVGEQR